MLSIINRWVWLCSALLMLLQLLRSVWFSPINQYGLTWFPCWLVKSRSCIQFESSSHHAVISVSHHLLIMYWCRSSFSISKTFWTFRSEQNSILGENHIQWHLEAHPIYAFKVTEIGKKWIENTTERNRNCKMQQYYDQHSRFWQIYFMPYKEKKLKTN